MEAGRKDALVESWDDGDFDGLDNLHFRNASSTTTASAAGSRHRESTGSRVSVNHDVEDDGDWQLLLANDDENSTRNAIENAKKKGIHLPSNIPPSALLGGTITRIGTRDSRRDLRANKPARGTVVDWDEDLELPAIGGLKLKIGDGKSFPEQLRNVSGNSGHSSLNATKESVRLSFAERSRVGSATISMKNLKDDDDFFFDDVPTVKVPKTRTIRKIPDFTPPTQFSSTTKESEAFEADFELPSSGTLKLSSRTHTPKTPNSQAFDDIDQDWAEGSHGSFGSISTSLSGTNRVGKSARSSSISARSPSIFSPTLSSCLTAESEDEGLDGLVLPVGPLDLGAALKKRTQNVSPELIEASEVQINSPSKDDFLEGLEIGPGPVFDTNKLTLNRNIKQRVVRQTSPIRRPATSLTFTNKPVATATRIPKPTPAPERSRPKLEPVSESGGPLSHYRNAASRLGSHSQQSSLSSIPTPMSVPIPPMPSTPSRRGLVPRASRDMLRTDSAQNNFLKNKRSLPVMSSTSRVPPSPARVQQPPLQRPVSRQDRPLRPNLTHRPRTPVDRAESSLAAARRPSAYPNTGHINQPRQLTKQTSRTFHRPTSSDSTGDNAGQTVRPTSRMSDRLRSNTPSTRRDLAPKSLARVAATKRVTEPVRRRGYGDGTELDGFDDLPTSAANEAKFVKHSTGTVKLNGTRRPLSGVSQASAANVNRLEVPSRLAFSPAKNDNNLPSFARSTAASRLAREQRLGPTTIVQAQRHPAHAEISHPTTNWKNIINSKPPPSPRHSKRPLTSKEPPRRPQLINKIGSPITKGGHGMRWNEQLLRWEGNESALAHFDIPCSPKHGTHNPSPVTKPALIANFSATKGVQVVGGMVFDPQRMMWVKMSSVAKTPSRNRSDSLTNTTTTDDAAIFDLDLNASDDEDPFAGIADLPDETKSTSNKSSKARLGKRQLPDIASPRSSIVDRSSSEDDAAHQAEEFDVGPSFVKRQQAEEEKWRRRLAGWSSILGRTDQALLRRNDLRELILRRS